ncbi:hypothetical protein C8R45DRAFT_946224 [Mycena sanguinolenta]|nr:hypothetical protein C8R45DRAFT_946224 [Mycena sanguinolenta]
MDEDIILVNKGCQYDVNKTDLDQVSTRVGIAMRHIPDGAPPTTDLHHQYLPVFSPEAHEYGPAFRITIMVAVNQHRDMVHILRSICGGTCEFITCTYDMIAPHRMDIDLADVQQDGPAPLPFLRPLEHLKLRLIYHMYRRYGNNTISDAAGHLLHLSSAKRSTTNMQTYMLITGVACRVHLPPHTLTVIFHDSSTLGSAVRPPDATAVLPMMWGCILMLTPLHSRGGSVVVVHVHLMGRYLLREDLNVLLRGSWGLMLIHTFSLLALLSIQVFTDGIYILFYSTHWVIRLLAQELFRQVSKQLSTVEVYSLHVADLDTDHGQKEFPGAFALQDPEDENLLEEDDEFVFLPPSMKNEAGRHYQAFTMYK